MFVITIRCCSVTVLHLFPFGVSQSALGKRKEIKLLIAFHLHNGSQTNDVALFFKRFTSVLIVTNNKIRLDKWEHIGEISSQKLARSQQGYYSSILYWDKNCKWPEMNDRIYTYTIKWDVFKTKKTHDFVSGLLLIKCG